ncbi:deoxyguanosinetriphosphate triphosphohydrolase-like protein [Fibrobacterales bacterium]|nr:deoxyguanosinetriphosphate triphosphohydrolase-like protein [Fibrobacterales bacterium]
MPITQLNSAILNEVEKTIKIEPKLSPFATKNSQAERYYPQNDKGDIRPPFFHDTDRIIHSKTYTRYIDKTQVFYLFKNDHLTHRVLHVQLVAKIARTLGRVLEFNEDLIEAIALGHDVGHTPFGHTGERYMSEFLKEKGEGVFCHNAQSFRQLHELEKSETGKQINLCVQTLDGVLCHNGEWVAREYKNYSAKTKEQLFDEYKKCLTDEKAIKSLRPMTMEGCIVRISDVIAYIGRDIEDAIAINLIKRDDIPKEVTEILGNTNKEIVNSLVLDIINNSYGKNSISFSDSVFTALNALKKWNYANIYDSDKKRSEDNKIKQMFNFTLNALTDFLNGRGSLKGNYELQKMLQMWFKEQDENYLDKNKPARVAADYLSGMTDDFLMSAYEKLVIPQSFGLEFKVG